MTSKGINREKNSNIKLVGAEYVWEGGREIKIEKAHKLFLKNWEWKQWKCHEILCFDSVHYQFECW